MKFTGGDLGTLKITEIARIDIEAANIRSKFITLDAGMSLVYNEKRREAEAYMANMTISDSETPHLSMESAKFSISRYDMAMTILISAHEWAFISAKIEELRTWHKDLIDKALTTSQVRIAAVVDWSEITSYL